MATITDPVTGQQFVSDQLGGYVSNGSLNATQALGRAMQAAGVQSQGTSKLGTETNFLGTLTPSSTVDPNAPIYRAIGPVGGQTLTPIDSQGNPIGPSIRETGLPSYAAPQNIPGGTGDIIPNLPALRGATTTGESKIDPSLLPYLQMGLQRAEQLFFGQPQPSMYPEQMYVSPSGQTLEALGAQEAVAREGAAPLIAGQQAYAQALGGIGQTSMGGFLQGSPYREQAIQAATRPLQQQFSEQILPGISSMYSKAGRYGSGAMERALGTATEASTRAIGDVASNIAYNDYARERALQQQAQGQQAALGALAPQFYQSQMLPAQTLAQVGQAQEAIAAQPLQEAIQRYQFQQQLPYQQLQTYLSSVYGTPLAASVYPTQPQAQTNQLGQAIGGAGLGYLAGNLFGGSTGGIANSTLGAGVGGLLGYFM